MTEVSSSVGRAGQVTPAPTTVEDASAQLARVDELPVAERVRLLAAVNEVMVAELAAMDEGEEGGLGAGASLRSRDRDKPPKTAGGQD